MKSKIKVTVGLCVKNCEATISEAVDSIINQNFSHNSMELIVVDGFSKDRTLSIIKGKLAKSDIKYKIFQENVGLGMARQIVVENASGEYILWVDGDMMLPSDYVKKQIDFMERNHKSGIVEGKYGLCFGKSIVSALENVVAVVHSSSKISSVGCLAATEGAIWRVKAIKQVKGFDVTIKGAAEDIEAAYRIKLAGWSINVNDKAKFQERCKETWKSLWDQYFWYGYGAHYLSHKNKGMITLYYMTPLAGFFAGLLYSFDAYRLTRRKIVFLLPIHYTFKRIAWCLGFVKAHMDGYGHKGF
ncbi:MAG: glycosyltransferase [Candidatus Baldrarchaeia archaeon]